jgi:hypothetical protein
MGDCRDLKSIYHLDPRKRMRGDGKDTERNDQRDDKNGDKKRRMKRSETKTTIMPTKIPTEPSAPYLAAR